MSDPDSARQAAAAQVIGQARADTVRLTESLVRRWDAIVESSALSTNDDEHDPEGATVAFERAQVEAMLSQARNDLGDLDLAAARVRTGAYWVCERCRGPIATDRLAARPAARTCIACANKVRW